MEKCVDRLHEAICKQEQICFYGDYDVDGISATSLYLSFFSKIGAQAEIYIPHRQKEGYGLNEAAIRKLAERHVKVLVTSDCGTTSHKEIALAQCLGLDVIVTDHHQLQEAIPDPYAFLNPYRSESSYPFKGLCSGGLAYKVAKAYSMKYPTLETCPEEQLDLVALSSVADVVPLCDENRLFVREGLRRITQGTRPGIRALKQIIGITGPCSASTVGFRIAPVINAAGRLAHADLGVRLLTKESDVEALVIAKKLEQLNCDRREIEQNIFKEAKALVSEDKDSPVIVVGKHGWHMGVVGIVASRLVEYFHQPAIVVAFNEDGLGKGSARSIPGYNIYEALAQCQEYLVGFGGHPSAAGVTVAFTEFPNFQAKMYETVRMNFVGGSKAPVLDIDAEVSLSELSYQLLSELEQFNPFGMGNPEPLFSSIGVRILQKKIVGDNHLKLVMRQNGSVPIECIGFRMGEWSDKLEERRELFDVVFTPEINRWKGCDRIQLRMRDLRVSKKV